MAQLAIKSHPTRGEEVVGILSMLGGIQCGYGSNCKGFYFIDDCKNIVAYDNIPEHRKNDFIIFTLEEFLKRYPYKVGDKVKTKHPDTKGTLIDEIIDMIWDIDKVLYELSSSDLLYFYAEELQPYKEETMDKASKTIFDANAQCCDIMNHLIKEETMEENIKEKCDLINFNSHYIFDFADKVELILKDDWEVKNEDGRTYVVRKQQTYPKTYHECYKILDAGEEEVLFDGATASEEFLFDSFIKLKRCRDAYWKIAGGWKPDVMYCDLYCIGYDGNVITWKMQGGCRFLVFPTEEMRDAFYENFKDLIEQCKELL